MQAAEMKNESASNPKASEVPPSATIEAPMAGPMMLASCRLRLLSELALGSISAGVISGMTAVAAGLKNALTRPKRMLAM